MVDINYFILFTFFSSDVAMTVQLRWITACRMSKELIKPDLFI
jgi:hypothetical protein